MLTGASLPIGKSKSLCLPLCGYETLPGNDPLLGGLFSSCIWLSLPIGDVGTLTYGSVDISLGMSLLNVLGALGLRGVFVHCRWGAEDDRIEFLDQAELLRFVGGACGCACGFVFGDAQEASCQGSVAAFFNASTGVAAAAG